MHQAKLCLESLLIEDHSSLGGGEGEGTFLKLLIKVLEAHLIPYLSFFPSPRTQELAARTRYSGKDPEELCGPSEGQEKPSD